MAEVGKNVDDILAFLRGGNNIDIAEVASADPELLARSIAYMLNGQYHRRNLVKAVAKLLNKGSGIYRGVAWQFVQQLPLSHLMELTSAWENKDNTKRLRHAVAVKLATESRTKLFRAFFMMPEGYRKLFASLYLPREKFRDKEVANENYNLARQLSDLSTIDAIEKFKINKSDLLDKFDLPFDRIMNYINNPQEAMELAKASDSKSFFEHARWYKNIAGDELYETIAMEKVKDVKNPLDFLNNRDHLLETGALTSQLIGFLEERANIVLKEIMDKFKLERIALVVDISGSMESAVVITRKLYEAFSRIVNVTDIVAFNHIARVISAEELPSLVCSGWTSIGSAIVALSQKITARGGRELPQVIVLVSDLEENRPPMLNESVELLRKYDIPLVVLQCRSRHPLRIDYPHAKIEVTDFHGGLLMDIVRRTAQLASKVAVKEKEITKVIKERRPIEEEIASVALPKRPQETYKSGYLEKLLLGNPAP